MYRRTIQRIGLGIVAAYAQKTRRLLEGLVTQAWHLAQGHAIRERPVGVTEVNDIARQRGIQP